MFTDDSQISTSIGNRFPVTAWGAWPMIFRGDMADGNIHSDGDMLVVDVGNINPISFFWGTDLDRI